MTARIKILNCLFFAIGIIILSACHENKKPSDVRLIAPGEGYLQVDGGKIWYKVSGNGTKTPLVLLHGGPGYSSFYLKPMEELGQTRQIIRYDQLGSGKSDIIQDTALFTIDHFVEDLEALRIHLGVDEWHVLGHSWGTIPAFEYYKKYPQRVKSLIFGSTCLDMPTWEKSTNLLLNSLPDSLQQAVRTADSTGIYDNPLYEQAINTFYDTYLWGDNYVQADLDSIMATANPDMYGYMWGPSEFSITGILKDYDASPELNKITIPALFTVGEFDEIMPAFVQEQAKNIKGAEVVVFKGSCHLTSWGAREENIQVVDDFLNDVDATYLSN